jgi:hypothetical protein
VAWVLTRGLTAFLAEVNEVFPGRDKTSDGTIGDQAHSSGVSGHNPDRTGNAEYRDGDSKDEVRAIDIDRDLVPGSTIDYAERVVQLIVQLARAGVYVPFRYVIYKRRIWSSSTGWATRQYTGANAHDKHIHLSGGYSERADEWTGRLGLAAVRGDEMELTDKITRDTGYEGRTVEMVLADGQNLRNFLSAKVGTTGQPWLPEAGSPARLLELLPKLAEEHDTTQKALDEVKQALAVIKAGMQAPVVIDYASLARAMFDEMERRATGGEEGTG